MNILLITAHKTTGLNYHRQLVPFGNLDFTTQEMPMWSDEFEDEYLKQFQVVSFLRSISTSFKTEQIVSRLHKLGIKVHFDIDDYWVLSSKHPMYAQYKTHKLPEQTIEALKLSDFITCTTKYLAERIKPYNENVFVLPNAINPDEEQWKITQTTNDLVRFGYIAGVHHNLEVEMLKPNFDKLWKDRECYGKFQLCPAGFNINVPNPPDKPYMNAYYKYVEQCFTDNYKHIKDLNYKEYLKQNTPHQNELTSDKPYRRLWRLDTFNYAKLYDLIDVSLVPLEQTMFSSNKSELKLIEAGFKKKACIVSNVMPYDLVATEFNSILIEPTRNHIDWYIWIKRLATDKEWVKELGEAMYETVKDKYHIKTVNIERKQIFEQWVG